MDATNNRQNSSQISEQLCPHCKNGMQTRDEPLSDGRPDITCCLECEGTTRIRTSLDREIERAAIRERAKRPSCFEPYRDISDEVTRKLERITSEGLRGAA